MDRIAVAVITWNWEYGRFEFKDQDSRGLWVKPECLDTDFGPNQTLATEGYPFCTLKVIQNYNDNNTSTPKCKFHGTKRRR
ncbi:hypothetical protein WN943_017476 [Citrus x changshan-huyou]